VVVRGGCVSSSTALVTGLTRPTPFLKGLYVGGCHSGFLRTLYTRMTETTSWITLLDYLRTTSSDPWHLSRTSTRIYVAPSIQPSPAWTRRYTGHRSLVYLEGSLTSRSSASHKSCPLRMRLSAPGHGVLWLRVSWKRHTPPSVTLRNARLTTLSIPTFTTSLIPNTHISGVRSAAEREAHIMAFRPGQQWDDIELDDLAPASHNIARRLSDVVPRPDAAANAAGHVQAPILMNISSWFNDTPLPETHLYPTAGPSRRSNR
jgi:hypothetical protein